MTFRDVIRSAGFKTMATGFVVMLIGLLLLAADLSLIGKLAASMGMFLGFVGFAMHTWMVLCQLGRKNDVGKKTSKEPDSL